MRHEAVLAGIEPLGALWHPLAVDFAPDALTNASARYRANAPFSAHVERDGNLITGQQPQSAASFARAIVEALTESAAERKAKDVLHRYHVQVWEQGKLAKAKDFLGVGFVSHATPFIDPRNGTEQKNLLPLLRTAFPVAGVDVQYGRRCSLDQERAERLPRRYQPNKSERAHSTSSMTTKSRDRYP